MNGKSRKVQKGYSMGFTPDYRHAAEMVAESEDLGCSGRADMDFAASEDSFALKRKRLGMEGVGCDQFGVPCRVFSFSKMSRLEKRDLEVTLTNELKQVRMLQSKIASFNSDAMVGPPANGIQRHQNGSQRSVIVGSFQKSGKKKGATGGNAPRTKSGAAASRRTAVAMQDPPHNTNLGPLMKQCQTILTRLMAHRDAYIFNEPVDIVKHKIPDYFTVIKQPMDLGTVKKKLLLGQYSHPMCFAADVRLTFNNALTYNPVGHDVHVMAGVLSKYFEVRWKPIEKKIPATADQSVASKSSAVTEPESAYVSPAKKQKTSSVEKKCKNESDQMVMSVLDKQKLSEELEASLEELPENIIEFLKQSSRNGSQVSEDEIEIDIDTLGDDTLFMLRKLLDDYMLEKQRNQTKTGQCEIEIGSVSGFSNLSAQPRKENEPADDDVDIGGDDPPPISSSSPIEIDKDVTRRNSNCSSSSSSSTDSGSSTSDTDSGNSLAGGPDGAMNSIPADNVNEAIDCQLEQKENDHCAANRDGHSELSPSNLSLTEPNSHQEGENTPPDRQVSPDKLYRAALLRSRYADIIIKAQENTNEKGERPDPEKLKLEREELERRRKEEKARLQAEAKAAEEARKKAEEQAAVEAKKKRELEREAARIALQQMEKTVEINENSQFMEDLEMFRAAPEEHLQSSFVEEASPENSQDCLGSFKFQASTNPLEQLGLYMKNDEEEEEVALRSIPAASNDPEEGEID